MVLYVAVIVFHPRVAEVHALALHITVPCTRLRFTIENPFESFEFCF